MSIACPPVFGDFECPQGYSCRERQCYDGNNSTSSICENDVECSDGTVCIEGKCYPLATIKCNRHVLTAEGQARSIVSDCGKRGKCVNGNCALDRCLGVSCTEGELCREGECVRVVDSFCIGHADCGPTMECRNNKCFIKNLEPICNCQPQEICHHGQCYPNTQCTSVYCGQGSYCVEGHCVNAIGVDCHEDTCHGGTVCVNGVCVVNPCPHRCPADQDCRLGECRLMEGLPCIGECKGPYECVDGRCRRNDCLRRVCQLGDSCEGGACVRVVGRFCTWAPRDCGHSFACHENKCVDLLTSSTTSLLIQQGNQLVN
uniref:Tenascin-like n=1 Tax=Heterorhabditis bacteriophora TaxID=37862 RepID=A0A1I7XNQ7_HETBA